LAHARTTALGASNVKRIARLQSQERVTNRINSTDRRVDEAQRHSQHGGCAKSLCGRLPPKAWPELRIRNAAARTRIVSGGWLWPGRRELSCYFKYMARGRIPEFESHHPSHAVVSSALMTDALLSRQMCDSLEPATQLLPMLQFKIATSYLTGTPEPL